MRGGAYVPPRVEDFGTLADLTAAHALLPTQTPLAAVTSLSAPSSNNGGTFGAPSAGGGPTAPTNVVSGTGPSGHTPTGTAFGGHHIAASHGHPHAHLHAPVAGVARPVGGRAGGSLPFTGFAATVLGAFGTALTALGVLLRRMDRRRSQHI